MRLVKERPGQGHGAACGMDFQWGRGLIGWGKICQEPDSVVKSFQTKICKHMPCQIFLNQYWFTPGDLAAGRLWGCCWGRPLILLEGFQGSQNPNLRDVRDLKYGRTMTVLSEVTNWCHFLCISNATKPSLKVDSYPGQGFASSSSLKSCWWTNLLAALWPSTWPWTRPWPKRKFKIVTPGQFQTVVSTLWALSTLQTFVKIIV